MTAAEAETVLGLRGALHVTSDNRGIVRKWLVAKGFPSMFVGGLSMAELAIAYNQVDGSGLEKLNKKLAEARENGAEDDDAPASSELPVAPVVHNNNGHGNGHGGDAIATIRDLLLDGYRPQAALDETAVRRIVSEALSAIEPRAIVIRDGDKPGVRIDGRTHPAFERVLRNLRAGNKVMLVGPAGCGKTTLASQLAKALAVDYGMLSGSAGVSEGEIKGWLLPVDGGKFEYCASDFVTKYERGNYLHLFDEIDGFDNNMLLSINCAIENGHFTVAIRRDNPVVRRGDNVFILASANTYGTGANPIYCGRNPMDEATRDRFVIIEMDYDNALETDIAAAGGLSASERDWLWGLREKTRAAQLRRVISTRAFQKAANMKAAGDDWSTIQATLLAGWSRDERAKVGA